jgi:threonine/homoserine/homoserine lactone efflux protein
MPLGPCRMSLILTIFVLVVFAQPMALLHGYIYGLTFLIILGPVFFTLLNSTLQYGFRSGFSVALGIFSSDLVCVGLLFGLGITDFFLHPSHQFWIGLVGALVLLGLGGAYAVKKPRLAASSSTMTTSGAGYSSFFLKGFVINFFNPFVFAVWMGFIALAAKFYPDPRMQSFFLGGMLLAILSTDTLKAALANYIKPLLKPQWLKWIFRITGVILAACGIYLLIRIF